MILKKIPNIYIFISAMILMILYSLPRCIPLIVIISKYTIPMTIWKLVISGLFTISLLLSLVFSTIHQEICNSLYYYHHFDYYFQFILYVIFGTLVMVWPMIWLASAVHFYHSNHSFVINWGLTQIATVIVIVISFYILKVILFIIFTLFSKWRSIWEKPKQEQDNRRRRRKNRY